jgi:hypothetical protein
MTAQRLSNANRLTTMQTSEAHKRPAASRGSSTKSGLVHKRQETELLQRPSSAASEPVAKHDPSIPSRGSSRTSQSAREAGIQDQDPRRLSPTKAMTLDIQRPRAGSRGMSAPTALYQSSARKTSISPVIQPIAPPMLASHESTRTTSPEVISQTSSTPSSLSPRLRTRTNSRPISPGSESSFSFPDRSNTMPTNEGGVIARYDSPDSVRQSKTPRFTVPLTFSNRSDSA